MEKRDFTLQDFLKIQKINWNLMPLKFHLFVLIPLILFLDLLCASGIAQVLGFVLITLFYFLCIMVNFAKGIVCGLELAVSVIEESKDGEEAKAIGPKEEDTKVH